jgi:hypothetical protein
MCMEHEPHPQTGTKPFDLRLFPPLPETIDQQRAILLADMEEHVGTQFDTKSAMAAYLRLIVHPPSAAWRYQLNGKSGNTFTLNLLYELEHGQPFSAQVATGETGNQHPDFALFAQVGAGLLGTALDYTPDWDAFCDFPGLRLATVRNPYQQALSGFRYLCRSHRMGDRRFLPERLRVMAMTGMDFERDSNTEQGFARFLAYLRDYAASFGAEAVDPHWRPQALHIRPDIYRPDIIGRTENMAAFAIAVAERLGKPQLPAPERLRRNQAEGGDANDLLSSLALRRIIEEIYTQDFDLFEYAKTDSQAG